MKDFSGKAVKDDLALINGLTEKFVKDNDPSVVVGKFLEKAGTSLSSIRAVYNKKAADRNVIVEPVLKEISEIIGACMIAKKDLEKHVNGTTSPEDDNRSLPSQ